MKRQLKLITLIRLSLIFSLLFTFSCSNEEYTEDPIVKKEIKILTPTNVEITSVGNQSYFAKATVGRAPCTSEGSNSTRDYTVTNDFNDTGVSVSKTIDDRTCAYNYMQAEGDGIRYGVYRIKANSNHIDDDRADGSQLQPRIERASKTINTTTDGSYVRMSGYVTIHRAGHASSSLSKSEVNNPSGTYIMQAKGKHDGATSDPAICLLVAKPNFSGSTQVSYDIYREQIRFRGGSGANGRDLVYLTNIPANTRRFIRMENGFRANRQQYVNIRIGGTDYNWDVPGNTGTQAKIRWGAYRCKGGEADIWWDGLSQTFNEAPAPSNNNSSGGNWDPANSITRSATMYASSSWSGSYSPAKGADGNWNSRWASSTNGTSHYLLAQFSGNRVVKRAKVRFESAYSSDFILWGRYNGQWYNLARVNNSAGNLDIKIEGFYGNADAYSIQSYAGPYSHISIREFELYPN